MGSQPEAHRARVADDWVAHERSAADTRRLAWIRTSGAFVAAIIVATVVLHVVWLARFRHGYVTEWDESGYLQFALSNFDVLHDQGPWAFVKFVGHRGTFGPLLPAVTALFYPIVGRGVFGSLLVMPLFFAGLVAAAFGLARQLVSDSWAVVAAFAVAAIPAVTDYSRIFHFALPATACMTAALWALVRSEGLRRLGWVAAAGLFVGLTLLSRTMTIAYVPGFALAAGALLLVDAPDLRARMRNLAIGAGVVVLFAGPWYLRNAGSVYDSLVGTGYGEGATVFGRHYPIASWGYWTKELRLDLSYLGLPLASVLLLCFGAALWYVLARRRSLIERPRSVRAVSILALVLVVVEGYLALTSSRNEGTGFSLPWLPVLVVLAVVAVASIPPRALRLALAAAVVAVSLGAVMSKSGWVEPLAKVRTASIPGLGSVTVTDGRGIIQLEVAGGGYDIGPITHPLPTMHRLWLPLAHKVDVWSLRRAQRAGAPLHLTLGLDDLIFGNSRLILAAQLWLHRYLRVDYLRPYPDGDTVAAYRHELTSPNRVNALAIGDPSPVKHPNITRSKVEAAARSLGFKPVKAFRMPDGRIIWMWWRDGPRTA
jgi:4-amino-4-deoxy-L-arabinose transferase-like glycosyltransferase